MLIWTVTLIAVVVVLGGLFAVLVVFSLSRSATGGDLDWQIARLERKVDLILTHLGIGHDEHVPEIVIGLARAGRTLEAIEEYRKLTGVNPSVARREIEYLMQRLKTKVGQDPGEVYSPGE
jgi:hypothetical protein